MEKLGCLLGISYSRKVNLARWTDIGGDKDAGESSSGEGPPEGGGEVRPALAAEMEGALDGEGGQVDAKDSL